MPIAYFSKRCPGARRVGCCAWSTDLIGQAAFIHSRDVLCAICTAIEGLDGSREFLQLHLADLYMLDSDKFREARNAMGDCRFDAVGDGVLQILTSSVPTLKRAREDQRKAYLARTLSLLTEGSWLIQCWTNRLDEDTHDLRQCEAAFGYFPVSIRRFIYEFVCGNVWKLHAHLCTVKRRGYRTLEQPIFWHPPRDFEDDDADDKPHARAMLVGVYSYIVKYMHKPKLESLKQSLENHKHCIKGNWAMQKYVHAVREVIGVVDSMLHKEITVVGSPFEFGRTV